MVEGINTSADEKNPKVFLINKTLRIHCSVSLTSHPPSRKKKKKKKGKKRLVIKKKKLHSAFGGNRLKGLFPIGNRRKSNVQMENNRIWLSPAKKGLDGSVNI